MRTSRYAERIARVGRRLVPRTADFAALLGEQADVAVEAVGALVEFARAGDPALAERVSQIEKRGDRLRERNLAVLNRSFTTVFDRDLTAVAIHSIDDVANYAKTTVREMDLLAVEPDPAVLEMVELLRGGAVELRSAIAALGGDPALVVERVGRVHKAERNVEKAYRAAVAGLFGPAARARWPEGQEIDRLLDALRRREVYRHLSNGADRLESAGRVIMDIAVATA